MPQRLAANSTVKFMELTTSEPFQNSILVRQQLKETGKSP